MTGLEIIAKERSRQLSEEGYTIESDLKYTRGELTKAAACYSLPFDQRQLVEVKDSDKKSRFIPRFWPRSWDSKHWKPNPNRIKELAKAGALIAAEIDRLQHLQNQLEKEIFDKNSNFLSKNLKNDK